MSHILEHILSTYLCGYKTLFYLVYKWNVIFGFGHSLDGFTQFLNFLNPGKFEKNPPLLGTRQHRIHTVIYKHTQIIKIIRLIIWIIIKTFTIKSANFRFGIKLLIRKR